MKLLFDTLASLFGLLLTSPIILIAAIIVRCTSEGGAFFAQERIGKDGQTFTCYKLRTMAAGTKQAGTHDIAASSVTSVGRILRCSKLDELPQLWNVLVGEMSLVGPRPCLPMQKELIEERTKRGVLKILPGITGLSQVMGIDMSEPVKLAEKDAEYIQTRSFMFDIKILLWTVIGKGNGDRVSG